ncbi:hypothetical protein OHB12_15630 [Nocardia sp. NBC_01730]|uniref:hypothetical protein n=1 Tax=Nocardia sp. NBC_01730 TaxID=2975998 RepID=UPI002E127699|nr:hypothetical protein OHB12_15630 [Nocardia sp. NBC_01730]
MGKTLTLESRWCNSVVRWSASTLHWAINGPDDILAAVPGARLLNRVSLFDSDTFKQVPGAYRVMGKVMLLVPVLRYIGQYYRYAFRRQRSAISPKRSPAEHRPSSWAASEPGSPRPAATPIGSHPAAVPTTHCRRTPSPRPYAHRGARPR